MNDLKDKTNQNPENEPTLYVGVGASAGGLEALETFFTHMSPQSGCAFIVIQHLSPDYKSLMVELLSKRTAMTVRRAEEGMLVERDTVYLIPPKKQLTIFHRRLILQDLDHSRGINLPIDIFLRSLADDQAEKSVGIILSGTGSDGVRGIRAIKEAGGVVMVQSEETAKFDGMPRAAMATGLADVVLPPDELAAKLASIARHPVATLVERPPAMLSDEDGLNRVFALLREHARVDFTYYKPSTVLRRIDRRLAVNQMNDVREYVHLLETRPNEVNCLFRELLIGVTSFFRDREVFEELEQKVLPELLEANANREMRFWVAGCSTGEEAYTLAILARECMEKLKLRGNLKIFATDIDREAIVHAGNGVYPESIAADLPPGMLTKYFNRKDDRYQVIRPLREMVVFAQHNLIKDPPFTNIDLLSCRNLLIYLQPVLQQKVMDYMNFSLNAGGVLLLGNSETTGDASGFFEPVSHKNKIYRSRGKRRAPTEGNLVTVPGEVLARPVQARFGRGAHLMSMREEERMLERLIQAVAEDFLPLVMVVNEKMEVLHIAGNPDGFLRLSPGKLINDLPRLAVKELAIPLATGLQKVFTSETEVKYSNVHLPGPDEARVVQLRLRLLPTKKGQETLAAVFILPSHAAAQDRSGAKVQEYDLGRESEQRIRDLEQELQFTKENLQATIEELETSNEELQATNEELLASNEELQSTNEELQSVNEELHTVNAEYQSKIFELTEMTNDLHNLMATTRIGTLFLDENLEIRKFTPEVARVIRILESDIGRPLADLTHKLIDVDIMAIVRDVEASGQAKELEVASIDDEWYLMRVLPYEIGTSASSGVVLTFTDIGPLKKAQKALDRGEARLASLYKASPIGVCLMRERVLLEVSDQVCHMLRENREQLVGMPTRRLYATEAEYERVGRELYDQLLVQGTGTAESIWRRKDGSEIPVLLTAAPLDGRDASQGVTLTILDLTARKQKDEVLKQTENMLKRTESMVNVGSWRYDLRSNTLYWSDEVFRIFGLEPGSIQPSYELFLQAVHPEDRDRVNSAYLNAVQKHQPYEITHRIRRPNGEVRHVREKSEEETDELGMVIASVGMIQDVTSEVDHEHTRKHLETFLFETIDALQEHIAILDSNGTIIFVNKAWRSFGEKNRLCMANDGVGASYLDICRKAIGGRSSENADLAVQGLLAVMSGSQTEFDLEYPCHSDNEQRWFEMRASRFQTPAGGYVVVSHTDISRRVRAEQKPNADSKGDVGR